MMVFKCLKIQQAKFREWQILQDYMKGNISMKKMILSVTFKGIGSFLLPDFKVRKWKASDLLVLLPEPLTVHLPATVSVSFHSNPFLLAFCLCFLKISLPKSWNFYWQQQHPCSLRKMERTV